MTAEIYKSLILLEASTGIEPVYTDLQSSKDSVVFKAKNCKRT